MMDKKTSIGKLYTTTIPYSFNVANCHIVYSEKLPIPRTSNALG
jgi:hypothetical protein